jgi:hypothetical protein
MAGRAQQNDVLEHFDLHNTQTNGMMANAKRVDWVTHDV